MTTKNDEILKTLSDMGLTLDSVFVPFSQSRNKAEQIYNDCMQIALKINRSLGTDGLNALREVYQDY